jgi:formate dehydrogenase subunit gamma
VETFDDSANEQIRRFSPGRILEHSLHVAIFAVLVATGLSQRFYLLDCSQWLILHMGGIDAVRLIHRFAGAVCCAAVTIHLAVAAIGMVRRRWQPTMLITRKDFTDVIHDLKYYLNLESFPARSGKYNYKQKFEYWAILSGTLLMMMTGFILWFPVAVTKYLPGQIIPAAKVLHTNEAMVVVLIISIWHIYNSVFSPEVFPLDTSIFTGYVSRERMLREHPDELQETSPADTGKSRN